MLTQRAKTDLEVSETPRGTLIKLPPRRIWGGYLFAFIGLFAIAFITALVPTILLQAADSSSRLIGLLFSLPFYGMGLLFSVLGLRLALGRVELEIGPELLVARESVGPFSWSRSVPIDRIAELKIHADDRSVGRGEYAGLVAQCEDGRSIKLLNYYPHGLVRQSLQAVLPHLTREKGAPPAVVEEPVDEFETIGTISTTPVPKPRFSRIKIEEWDGGVRFTIPPPGLIKGSRGLFIFSLVWLLFTGVMLSLWIFQPDGTSPRLVPLMVLSSFVIVGIGMLLFSIHMGRMRGMIQVDSAGFRAAWMSPFKQKVIAVDRADLKAVRVGPSSMEMNNRPIMELKVVRKDGSQIGLFANLSDDELHWIADRVRRVLAR